MNVFEEIKATLSTKIKNKEITMSTSLKDLGLDSLDLLSFVVDAEEKFKVQVDEEKLRSVKSIADVVALFEEKLI